VSYLLLARSARPGSILRFATNQAHTVLAHPGHDPWRERKKEAPCGLLSGGASRPRGGTIAGYLEAWECSAAARSSISEMSCCGPPAFATSVEYLPSITTRGTPWTW
jgi:hypothetical protein